MHYFLVLVHLLSLVIGYGAVMVIDIYGLLFVMARRTREQLLSLMNVVQFLVWFGFTGLILSGIFLHPDPTKPLTRLKMLLVLIIGLNGLNLHFVQKTMRSTKSKIITFRQLPRYLIIWSVISITLSQLAWLSATAIGLYNTLS